MAKEHARVSMRTMETTTILSREKRAGIRWKRVGLGGFLSEIGVIAVISAIIAIHLLVAPGQTDAQLDEFASLAGYYAAAPAAAVLTFLSAFCAVRKLENHFIANGALVGTVATLLTLGFIFGAKPEHRLMYIISFAIRIAAGSSAGFIVQKRKG